MVTRVVVNKKFNVISIRLILAKEINQELYISMLLITLLITN